MRRWGGGWGMTIFAFALYILEAAWCTFLSRSFFPFSCVSFRV